MIKVESGHVFSQPRSGVFLIVSPLASAKLRSILFVAAFLSPLLLCPLRAADTTTLTIVDAGVENAEDAPFVPASYVFLPGDYVYSIFAATGFRITGDAYSKSRQMKLEYTFEILDAHDVPLAPAQTGVIADEISAEDKHWMPRRRASFLLPSYVAAGVYHVRISISDPISKENATRDFPFRIGGLALQPSPSLTVQNFRFLRSDADGPGIDPPAYRAGDTVWARFDITGFQLGPGNTAELRYGVTVLRPNGAPIFSQPDATGEKLKEFYPPQFIPGMLSVTTTPGLPHGEYTMVVELHDHIGKRDGELRFPFQIE